MLLRPYNPADAAEFLELLNAATGLGISLESFLAQNAARPAQQTWVQVVAERAGRVSGMALLRHFDYLPPGWLLLVVAVEPAARGHGMGSDLLNWAIQQAIALEVVGLGVNILDHDLQSRAWAQRRGFTLHAHRFASVLDLSEPQPEPELPAGVSIRDMTGATPAEWERLEALYGDLLTQTPDLEGQPRWTPEQLRSHVRDSPRLRPQWTLVAVSETGEWLALSQGVSISTGIYNELTGTVAQARGRGLARALKLELIRRARAESVPLMRTNNHAANLPMLNVNRRLGFRPLSGSWELRRALA